LRSPQRLLKRKWMERLYVVIGLAAALVACAPAGDDDHQVLDARLRVLEERATAPASHSEEVRNDIKALERRLAVLESEVIGLTDLVARDLLAGEDGEPDALDEGGRTRPRRPRRTRAEREERRTQLRQLTTEYRERLGELRQQFSDDPRDPASQEAIREVLDWYRTQRQAILRGEDAG
jgi:hypothetical protein